ncbi:hypothetical protein AB0J72_39095 [Dactylosporangium sp. NPDC049742]|uniref:hypothetical protein n=1 Tax=Dactylosporangium sp. NPDC049742 TaxID=3154737 RepID=UPI003446A722
MLRLASGAAVTGVAARAVLRLASGAAVTGVAARAVLRLAVDVAVTAAPIGVAVRAAPKPVTVVALVAGDRRRRPTRVAVPRPGRSGAGRPPIAADAGAPASAAPTTDAVGRVPSQATTRLSTATTRLATTRLTTAAWRLVVAVSVRLAAAGSLLWVELVADVEVIAGCR